MRHLFLHGLGQDAASWDKVLAALETEGNCPALASFFQDGENTYEALYRGFSDYCENLDAPLFLCGLSLGAVLALHYALDHPERLGALVLIAPQYRMPKRLLKLQSMIFRHMPASAFAETGLKKEDYLSLTGSMLELDLSKGLERLTCPVLVLCGERDRVNRKAARSLAAELSQARLQMVPGAGHEVNRDAPEELAGILEAFWKNCSYEKGGSPDDHT